MTVNTGKRKAMIRCTPSHDSGNIELGMWTKNIYMYVSDPVIREPTIISISSYLGSKYQFSILDSGFFGGRGGT